MGIILEGDSDMPAWMNLASLHWVRLLLEAAALFVAATFVFDAIHYTLHRCLSSRWRWLRRLASPHQSHHDFCDRQLIYHDETAVPNLMMHVLPEYATQMAVCAMAFWVLDPSAVIGVMAGFTVIFLSVVALRGKDRNHTATPVVRAAHGGFFVRAAYHALHHVYPENYMSSYTTLFDRAMGTGCQIQGRRVALTGASGSFGSALKALLERAGAEVVPLKFGVDYTYSDYSGADAALGASDILVLAHGAKGEQAMAANCDSFLALIERFRILTKGRQIPVEVWAVGSEIECHPAFGGPELRGYARSKRAYARAAASLVYDPHVLYRHIVPSSFRSAMGPGLMSGGTAAGVAFWLIRRGFRYVPVTYTGIALLNFIPFTLRALLAAPPSSRRERAQPAGPLPECRTC
jgi:monoglucosyldiacylglycerol epimerase